MLIEELSQQVADLFSGVLKFAGDLAPFDDFAGDIALFDDLSPEQVQEEVNQLKQVDIKGLTRSFKVKDIHDLFHALKVAHMGETEVELLAVEETGHPPFTAARGEFDE